MNYTFPTISRIEDVLPHIKDCEEIKVADKGEYTVINYVVQTNDTFPPLLSDDDIGAKMRRECRGLIFDKTGALVSRPFHKFFNIGEREETLPENINISDYVVFEKADGSMIRPIMVGGVLELATKMGVTDIAVDAKEWMMAQPDYKKKLFFLEWAMSNNVTPIFEWVSPDNKIVVSYEKPDLILTALRDNTRGFYYNVRTIPACPFTIITSYSAQDDLDEFLAEVKQDTSDREGFVLRSKTGHMYKIKTDQYVELHRLKDEVQSDRHILRMILEERVDDIFPKLDDDDKKRVDEYMTIFWKAVYAKHAELFNIYEHIFIGECKGDRKDFALRGMSMLRDTRDSKFIFGMAAGKDLHRMLLDHLDKNSQKNVKYEELASWLQL